MVKLDPELGAFCTLPIMPRLKIFSLFPFLPDEIQLLIWKEAISKPRLISIVYIEFLDSRGLLNSKRVGNASPYRKAHRICRKSREESKVEKDKSRKILVLTNGQGYPTGLCFINIEKDVLLFSYKSFPYLHAQDLERGALKFLGIDMRYLDDSLLERHVIPSILTGFRYDPLFSLFAEAILDIFTNLTELILVFWEVPSEECRSMFSDAVSNFVKNVAWKRTHSDSSWPEDDASWVIEDGDERNNVGFKIPRITFSTFEQLEDRCSGI